MRRRVCALVCVLALAPWGAAHADIVNPARLELNETVPGVFDVVFTLPVVNGRRVKATPVLPDVSADVTEHQTVSILSRGVPTSILVSLPHGRTNYVNGLMDLMRRLRLR